jgi:hypothetical protein|tara:strand:+ start:2307 stop:2651 length:345 start_codon:yes stop_codon:yes gene_type:complete
MPFGSTFNRAEDLSAVADGLPNVAAPLENQQFRTPINEKKRTRAFLMLDAGTLDVDLWVLDETSGNWFLLNPAPLAMTALAFQQIVLPPDAMVFPQLSNPTGAPEQFGIAIVGR